MNLKCGIVGLPNVGKSTLFNALTKLSIQAENYPFCTIEPNVGIVEVPDYRLSKLSEIVKPQRVQHAIVEFVDIAGLVAGASKGEGLGNQFLANIRQTNAIINVVRCFEDDNIIHVYSKVDPISDIQTINLELILADLATVEKILARESKHLKSGTLIDALRLARNHLSQDKALRSLDPEALEMLKQYQLLTTKPSLYLANVNESEKSKVHLQTLKDFAQSQNVKVLDICVLLESEICNLEEDEKIEFLKDTGMHETGLNRLIRSGYELLGLQTYFTAGTKEVRAWTIQKGDTAPRAASVIHTDFEKGFIRAQVISYDDFISCGGEAKAKEAGKIRSEGKDYIVKDGDIINFLFNV